MTTELSAHEILSEPERHESPQQQPQSSDARLTDWTDPRHLESTGNGVDWTSRHLESTSALESTESETGDSTPSEVPPLEQTRSEISHLAHIKTQIPKPLLVKSRTTGDFLQHHHDQARRRFLIDQGGPLAARPFEISEDYGLDELRAPPILPERERRKSLEHSLSRRPSIAHRKSFQNRLRDDVVVGGWITFLSIWGALARIGLTALSTYPGVPVFPLIWAQFVGCAFIGFLLQDKTLFPKEERYVALYIGLTTGFCGSLTSFSSFMWDCFRAMANLDPYSARGVGDNVLALISQVIITLCVSIAALRFGAHVAQVVRRLLPSITPLTAARQHLDILGVTLGVAGWAAAGIMTGLLPQYRQELFTTVLAPLGMTHSMYNQLITGALCRWQLSRFNPVIPSFPLGTFAANMIATAILGICNLIQSRVRTPMSIISCAVLYGIDNGFCGSLSTVSTFAVELDTLVRQHAYIYATVSISSGVVIMILVVGISAWSQGYIPVCGL